MKQWLYRIIYDNRINFLLRKINKVLYPILPKWLKIPPSGKIRLHINGKHLKIATNQTSYLTQKLYWNGYREFEYTELFINLIKEINSFYDIGANIGYYSLLAVHVNPEIKVKSFEPAEGPLHYLKENVELNKFKDSIRVENIALSSKVGKMDFYEVKNDKYSYLKYNLAGEGNLGSKRTQRNFVKNVVMTTTLDKYVEENNREHIDLIKMDTEGSEHLILRNASRVINDMKPIIICETLFNAIEVELDAIMKGHGYEFYNCLPGGLVKTETIVRQYDNKVRNCFFVHPSKQYLIEKFIV